ncbi:chloride channel [Epithele typhae]|uniref:chloride channel n=1 Tax=Epithele typhae TaxID=378194 RepID=UPI00200883A7|nr:chloride channel [Epithele typhae]KAH9942350.1 chloride channel [Epithele typhae]
MPLSKSPSNAALRGDDGPSGPLSGPSTAEWRRQRLLQIGTSSSQSQGAVDGEQTSETSALRPELGPRPASYGTLPTAHGANGNGKQKASFRARHAFSNLSDILVPKGRWTNPPTPSMNSPHSLRNSSYFTSQRPISAYDKPVVEGEGEVEAAGMKTNGVRVWYSSFTSVDWLHDAIKDTARQAALLRRKSKRGRVHRQLDRSIGWITVTVIGFLTAIVAFFIVRAEQWLFDVKEGYCTTSIWRAKRFCCPTQADESVFVPSFVTVAVEEDCPAWRTWDQHFQPLADSSSWLEAEAIDYVMYIAIAILLAVISSLLTIYLTASTSFVTRKDSGVLSPTFASGDDAKSMANPPSGTPRKVLYYAAGSGIPEIKTILSGFVIHGYLGGRTLFTKSVGLALSVASGLSLGKEGPFVHIASCIGNIVSRIFSKYETNEGKRRGVLSAACAAGVAVAFGAPVGGVLFSLEEVSYFFPAKVMWRSFFCAMVAAVTLRFLDPFGSGKLVLFQVTYDKDWHAYELFPFLLLGVFGGVYGAYFSKLNYRWSRHVRNGTWMKTYPVMEVVLITGITAILSFLNPYTKMGGTELVYNLFAECREGSSNSHSGLCVLNPPTQAVPIISALLIAMFVKGVLTIVTFGIKVPAGIFIPTLGVGACAGRVVGILIQWAQFSYPNSPAFKPCGGDLNCIIPGLYAMVGAAATLAGATRTTVSLAVIMFELTDTLTYAVPVMLSVLVAKTVADAIEPKGIYDLVIELSQLPYLDAKHEYIWGAHTLTEVADRDVEVIRVDRTNTVKTLCDRLQSLVDAGHSDSGFPILRPDEEDNMRMVGYIGANELEHALSIVADDADEVISFHPTDPHGHGHLTASVSSLAETGSYIFDPYDFSPYMDQAPLTVQDNSPLELVQQFFTKLGARYVVVTDTDGHYQGVIDKKTWLGFLDELEHQHD